MPIEESVTSWRTMSWRDQVTRDELLQRRIELFSQTPEKDRIAAEKINQARQKNKEIFDKTHKLRPSKIKVEDWVLVSDNTLDNQHSTEKKFKRRWKGPYVVLEVYPNCLLY